MDALTEPLTALYRELGCFVRLRDIRLLHVTVDGALRDAALELAMDFEYHADNRTAFVRLDAPQTLEEANWPLRIAALRDEHEKRRAGMAKHGYSLPALPPFSTVPTAPVPSRVTLTGVLRRGPMVGEAVTRGFVVTLEHVLRACTAPLDGLTVVLAPGQVADAPGWDGEWQRLLTEVPSIATVRWIVVDLGEPAIPRTLQRLGNAAVSVRCMVDERAAQRDLAERAESQLRAPDNAPVAAQNGAAWPRELPPGTRPSVTRSAAELATIAAAAGVPVALLAGVGALRKAQPWIMKAALAMRRREPMAAVEHQRRACVLCAEGGLAREATVMQLLLASYLANAGQRAAAVDTYEQIATRAEAEKWHELGAQALMAAGAMHLVDGDTARAAATYTRAGELARVGNQRPLAIESYRMAGQLRLEARDADQAVRLFGAALQVAGAMPPADAGQTSAPVAARALATHCRRVGLGAQADSLEAQAARMEASTGQAPA